MKIIDSLQPEDRVYDLRIEYRVMNVRYELIADCKHKENINKHGPLYHYDRIIARSHDRSELESLKVLLEKYRKA